MCPCYRTKTTKVVNTNYVTLSPMYFHGRQTKRSDVEVKSQSSRCDRNILCTGGVGMHVDMTAVKCSSSERVWCVESDRMRWTLFHALVVAVCSMTASWTTVDGQQAMLFQTTHNNCNSAINKI